MYKFRNLFVLRKLTLQQPVFTRSPNIMLSKLLSDHNGNSTKKFPIESKIQDILREKFPLAEYIEVQDISGGCGTMFEICVIAEQFKGLTLVKQHRLINEALKEEIKDMHGLRINTAYPSQPT